MIGTLVMPQLLFGCTDGKLAEG